MDKLGTELEIQGDSPTDALIDDIPTFTPTPAAARNRDRRGVVVSWFLSLTLHAALIALLIRLGVWATAPRVLVQGGSISSDIDTGTAARPVAADLPHALPPTPAAPDSQSITASPTQLPDPTDLPPTPTDTPNLLLASADTSPLIGVALTPIPLDGSLHFTVSLPPDVTARLAANASAEQGGTTAATATGPSGSLAADTGPNSSGNSASPAGVPNGSPIPATSNRPPRYPAEAKRKHWEGTVWLDVEVTEDGSVATIAVDQSSGYDLLDKEALDAVRRWKFIPAQDSGHPTRSRGRVPVEFVLRG